MHASLGRTSRIGIALVATCLFVVASSGAAAADTNAFYGSYSTSAGPLSYNSSGGNGLGGVGWDVAGFPKVERTSPGGGAPRYDGTDVYHIGGQKLIPCAEITGTSPGCDAGGTHAAEKESYTRIVYDATADTWTVTTGDGTRNVYEPTFVTPSGTFFWGLARTVPTIGFDSTYTWLCLPVGSTTPNDCYPRTSSSNGSTVTYQYEARPDPISFAIGIGVDLGTTNHRLKTVSTRVGGQLKGATTITYSQSASGRSLVSSVTSYGRDVVIDGNTIVGGTALPAKTMTYDQAGSSPFALATDISDAGLYWSGDHSRAFVGDWNGDGKDDLLQIRDDGNQARAQLSNGDGTFAVVTAPSGLFLEADRVKTVVGDYDADGFDDLLQVWQKDDSGRDARVLRSNGDGSFSIAWQVTGATYDSYFWRDGTNSEVRDGIVGGDFNGDGRSDVMQIRRSSTEVRVLVGGEDGSLTLAWQGLLARKGDDFAGFPADLDGDGDTDLVQVSRDWGPSTGVYIYEQNGTGAFAQVDSIPRDWWGGMLDARAVHFGDWNGDGLSEPLQIQVDPARHHTYISDGTGSFFEIADAVSGTVWRAADATALVADFNGDGRSDILQLERDSGSGQLLASNGDGHFTRLWSSGALKKASAWNSVVGDWNGDGLQDLVQIREGSARARVYHAHSAAPDRLVSVANGIGGVETIAYTPSSAWDNTNNPPVVSTVTAVTSCDGRGNCSTATAEYAGGLYDRVDRRFLGFRYAREWVPVLPGESEPPAYNETWFKQDYGSLAQVERSETRDKTGFLWAVSINEYETNGNLTPYTSRLTGEWKYTYDEQGGSLRSYKTTSYDAYGNAIQQVLYGNYDVTGDERTLVSQYFPNTSAYIVSAVARVDVYGGVGTGGPLLAQSMAYYDGQDDQSTGWQLSPTVGLATQSAVWLNNPNSYVLTQTEYDAWGNPVLSRDPLGNEETFTLDSTYHQFVISSTDPLGNSPSATWDPVCGVATASTDINGQVTTHQLDALCRVVRTDYPGGGWTETSYGVNEGDPNAQYTEQRSPHPDGSVIWSRSYYDGLGRTYKAMRRGPEPGKEIVAETTWDARGRQPQPTRPHFVGDPVEIAGTFEFDAMDRVTGMITPGGKVKEFTYAGNDTIMIDPMGREVVSVANAFGQTTATREYHDGLPVETSYTYDGLGNLVAIVDPAGNVSQMAYDSLRRRTQISDPDTGLTTYEYNVHSQLIAETDAKGQRTERTYDATGRLLTETKNAGTTEAVATTRLYDEARTGYFNSGHLTTMIDSEGSETYDYDAAGRLVRTTRTMNSGASYTFEYQYSTSGHLIGITYPDGDQIGGPADPYRYNGAGQLVSIPGIVDHIEYDAMGRMIERTNANGTVTSWQRSVTDGLLEHLQTVADTTTIQDMTYTRDLVGKITNIQSPFEGESWGFVYDDLDRLVEASRGDCTGELTCTTEPMPESTCDEGLTGEYYDDSDFTNLALTRTDAGVNFDWDSGAPASGMGDDTFSIRWTGFVEPLYSETYTFSTESDDGVRLWVDGQLVIDNWTDHSPTWDSGAISLTAGTRVSIELEYYENGGGATIGLAWASASQDSEYIPATQLATNCTTPTCPEGTTEIESCTSPDDCETVCETCTDTTSCSFTDVQSWDYDAIGNMTYNSEVGDYTYPDPGQPRPHAVLTAGIDSYSYDANGNMVAGGGRTITYDATNLPTSINGVTFGYSGGGKRLYKDDGVTRTEYFGDHYQVTDGVVIKHIAAGGEIVAKRTGGATYWLHNDHLGSIQAITDETGAQVQRMSYAPYGEPLSTATGHDEPLGFTGQPYDDETGLSYLGARYYDPKLGRFMSPDLLAGPGETVGLNRYAYAKNNPVRYVDPTGLEPGDYTSRPAPTLETCGGRGASACGPIKRRLALEMRLDAINNPGRNYRKLERDAKITLAGAKGNPMFLGNANDATLGLAMAHAREAGFTGQVGLSGSELHTWATSADGLWSAGLGLEKAKQLANLIDLHYQVKTAWKSYRRAKKRGRRAMAVATFVSMALPQVSGFADKIAAPVVKVAGNFMGPVTAEAVGQIFVGAAANGAGATAGALVGGSSFGDALEAGAKAGISTLRYAAPDILIGAALEPAARAHYNASATGDNFLPFEEAVRWRSGTAPTDPTGWIVGKLWGNTPALLEEGSGMMQVFDLATGGIAHATWHDPFTTGVASRIPSGPLQDLVVYSTNFERLTASVTGDWDPIMPKDSYGPTDVGFAAADGVAAAAAQNGKPIQHAIEARAAAAGLF